MVWQGRKGLALAGLLGALGLIVGCEERRPGEVREEARKAGQAVDEAAQETRKAAEEARETTQEAIEGFEEGLGGSGQSGDAGIGDQPGVIDDGEGPLEENERR
ncbi:hypothetical protein [Archangium lansingense]|uniref:Latency associated antigen n=1 Tax=Archangium lansingense TaxID=2995310 RepID=A0ABT4AEE5_9BACT|nr:hypothetical protein [Archangium lansinium]MCY1080056.1 hypothetical protein [Archangium lansinium]